MKLYSHSDGSYRGVPENCGSTDFMQVQIDETTMQDEIKRIHHQPIVDFAKAIRYSSKLQHAIHQDKLWTDREGNVWALEEMDEGHQLNLLFWLEDKMQSLHIGAEFTFVIESADQLWPNSDAVQDSIDAEMERISQMTDDEWFNQLPLIIRLRELTGEK